MSERGGRVGEQCVACAPTVEPLLSSPSRQPVTTSRREPDHSGDLGVQEHTDDRGELVAECGEQSVNKLDRTLEHWVSAASHPTCRREKPRVQAPHWDDEWRLTQVGSRKSSPKCLHDRGGNGRTPPG